MLKMGNKWRTCRLGDIFDINPARPLKRGSASPFIPMDALPQHARTAERIASREYTGSGMRFRNGDTLIARITPCLENGKTAFVSGLQDGEVAHGSTEYIVLAGKDGQSDSLFGYYLARTQEFRCYAISHMEGTSGRQRVPASAIEKYRLALPPLATQHAIAHILGTLDDKIELNRRINQTLENMAQALFKSWFVDFDGVAKKDRQQSELGLIPKGWRVRTIGDGFSLTMGQSPPGNTYNDEGVGLPFFQGRTDFGFRYPNNRKFCSKPARIANPDDTLVSVRAPVGDINLAWETCCIGRGVAAIRHGSGSRSFTYYAMNRLQKKLEQFEHTGTVFGSINKAEFEKLKFVEPPANRIMAYEQYIKPLDDAIKNNIAQSRTLAALRDTLLPRLMSGTLRIAAPNAFLEMLP